MTVPRHLRVVSNFARNSLQWNLVEKRYRPNSWLFVE